MDSSQFQHLAIVLTHLNDATVDWAKVADERGVKRKDNALTSFKQLMKKHGVEYENRKFSRIIGFESAADGLAVSTPKSKKPRTPRKRQSEDENADSKEEKPSPTKKQRVERAAERAQNKDKESASNEDVKDETD
ncbi:hypothetical protein LTR70_001546 [Exophiala xenobiotica]|uniref:Uncharacterized protein n=1 Tax=Lithohypha guttulata TaxID=1690604 RepID=A0ABR0KDM7_9EURO|nr:hypothetical protein LTR24_004009 [Lithohypha guttulata]KAK5327923.1 hypothetical protein LTR70_001546 [Exophiala xenobiotica]